MISYTSLYLSMLAIYVALLIPLMITYLQLDYSYESFFLAEHLKLTSKSILSMISIALFIVSIFPYPIFIRDYEVLIYINQLLIIPDLTALIVMIFLVLSVFALYIRIYLFKKDDLGTRIFKQFEFFLIRIEKWQNKHNWNAINQQIESINKDNRSLVLSKNNIHFLDIKKRNTKKMVVDIIHPNHIGMKDIYFHIRCGSINPNILVTFSDNKKVSQIKRRLKRNVKFRLNYEGNLNEYIEFIFGETQKALLKDDYNKIKIRLAAILRIYKSISESNIIYAYLPSLNKFCSQLQFKMLAAYKEDKSYLSLLQEFSKYILHSTLAEKNDLY